MTAGARCLQLHPVVRENYRLGVPRAGEWVEALNTDAGQYGGSNVGNSGSVRRSAPWQGRSGFALLTLPPLATLIFRHAG
jgi:1,4-alpha-glucan branching enzyme